jgi:hypothetical protein
LAASPPGDPKAESGGHREYYFDLFIFTFHGFKQTEPFWNRRSFQIRKRREGRNRPLTAIPGVRPLAVLFSKKASPDQVPPIPIRIVTFFKPERAVELEQVEPMMTFF